MATRALSAGRGGLCSAGRAHDAVQRIVVVERRFVEIVRSAGAGRVELRFDPTAGGRGGAPLRRRFESEIVAFGRAARHRQVGGAAGEVAADEGLRRQPPVRQRAEGQHALVILVLVVLSDVVRAVVGAPAAPAAAMDQPGAVAEQPEAGQGEQDGDDDRGDTGRIGAYEQRRQPQRHVAEDAAEAGGQGPCGRRREAAGHAGDEDGRGEPCREPARHAVDAARRHEEDAPDDRRDEPDDGRKAVELHGEVGEDGARIAHGIGDGIRRRVAEARIGDVPRAEAGEREGDEDEQANAGETPYLAQREGVQTALAPRQR